MAGFLRLLLAIVLPAGGLLAQMEPFYIGTYTHGQSGGKGIYASTLDAQSGTFGPVSLAAEMSDPSFLAISPNGKNLYAALESQNAVAAYALSEGKLAFLNWQSSDGAGPCFVSLDSDGKYVFVANYGIGGAHCLPVNADGSLSPVFSPVPRVFLESALSPSKQQHAHCAIMIGRFVYISNLGQDDIDIHLFDRTRRDLPPDGNASTPPGSGPRHLAASADGRFVYVANEKSVNVCIFTRDPESGALTLLETVSSPNISAKPGVTGAEIAIHPSGKWLYTSTRGADLLSLYSVGADGKLTWVEDVPSSAKTPRNFAIDPSGKWLLAAGQADNRIVVFRIDPQTGRLTQAGSEISVPSPVCIAFAPVSAGK